MSEQNKDQKPNISIGGSVSGGNVNVGGNQTFGNNTNIGSGNQTNTDNSNNRGIINSGTMSNTTFTFTENNMPAASEDVRQQLQTQINQLMAELEKLKAENPDEVAEVTMSVQDAVAEAQQGSPDKSRLEIRGKNLMKAAKNLAAVAPIAVQIAKTLLMIP